MAVGIAPHFSRTPGAIRREAPRLGEHGAEPVPLVGKKLDFPGILDRFMVMTRILSLPYPGLGLVGDLCHSYPGKGVSEDFKEQKWLKISPNKSVT